MEDEQCGQNRQVDQQPDESLVVELLHLAVPEEQRGQDGNRGRAADQQAPPVQPGQETDAADHEHQGGQGAEDGRQQTGGLVAHQPGERPRAVGPGQPGTQLEEPEAVAEVEHVNQSVQYEENPENDPDQENLLFSNVIPDRYCSGKKSLLLNFGSFATKRQIQTWPLIFYDANWQIIHDTA